MIADRSPVELFELQGEQVRKRPQGPRNASLERCDLGHSGILTEQRIRDLVALLLDPESPVNK
jgi:hypothetical protein